LGLSNMSIIITNGKSSYEIAQRRRMAPIRDDSVRLSLPSWCMAMVPWTKRANEIRLSTHNHGNIHRPGAKAIEPSAMDDNGNDDPQNLTKPDQIDQNVRLTNADRPSEEETQKPPPRNGNGGVHASTRTLSADASWSYPRGGHPFRGNSRRFNVE
jgi:hypothetical protein